MFQPILPMSGYGGWTFLQATYDRQLQGFSDSPQIRNDQEYLLERLSEPMTLDALLDDRRLLRVSMTAFGLGGEEWKRGFIEKALNEAADPDSTFLLRLNNPRYNAFADVFAPIGDVVFVGPSARADIAARFAEEAFEAAVGEIDNSMRLALNYRSEIAELVGSGSGEDAILFRLLGDVPVRTVLEGALNLPVDFRQLPVDRQAETLKERLVSAFGIADVSELASGDMTERVIQRFQLLEAVNQGASATTPGSTALALLNNTGGLGDGASRNLFLSLVG